MALDHGDMITDRGDADEKRCLWWCRGIRCFGYASPTDANTQERETISFPSHTALAPSLSPLTGARTHREGESLRQAVVVGQDE